MMRPNTVHDQKSSSPSLDFFCVFIKVFYLLQAQLTIGTTRVRRRDDNIIIQVIFYPGSEYVNASHN